jgi:hypothetical protein
MRAKQSPAAGNCGARSTDFLHSGIDGRNTTARAVSQALGGTGNGKGFLCRCPVPSHGKGNGDRNPSLSVADGDKGLLVRCFAGCDQRDVLAELRSRGLLGEPRPATQPVRTFKYEYRNPVSGEVRYRKIRREYCRKQGSLH